ncbi:MAG TPA: hypothetical protein VFF28_05725 [Candidatus Nanoarchaeia archaeon]|nr:hypothetical protein [Candidatus Nanoarchaeia archaeon]
MVKNYKIVFDMSEIALGARSDALAQSKPAISEHAQKRFQCEVMRRW